MSLRSLSDLAILDRIKRLTRCERSCTLRVLECLVEIEWRKLHFALGYSSLYNFCTSGLGYSGSAAGRRIQTGRAMARFPEIVALLRTNEVNVCTISRVSRLLTPDNKEEILARIRGRSLDEVIAIAAEYRPPADAILDRVRDVVVAPPRAPLLASMPWRQERADAAPSSAPSAVPVASAPAAPEGDLQHRIVLRFGVSAAFMAKLDRVRALAWHRLPANATLEHVFELVMDDTLRRTDPITRREHRERRAVARNDNAGAPARSSLPTDSPAPRNIPVRVRDEVFARDRGRCTYVAPDGRRCDATRGLQIDHVVPVARGGTGEISNLRLMCAQHNRLLAERILGNRTSHPHDGSESKRRP